MSNWFIHILCGFKTYSIFFVSHIQLYLFKIKKKIEMGFWLGSLCIINNNNNMSNTIIDGTQFNAENIQYSAPKLNATSAGKTINILNKQTKTGIRVSTPLLLTWGASDYEGNGKFNFSLQFPQEEYKTEESTLFLNNFIAFEKKIKKDALTNSKEWLGKTITSMDVLDVLFSPILKYPKNKESGEIDFNKSPTLNIKLPFWDGKWTSEIFDEDRNKIFPSSNPTINPLTLLAKGSNIACLLQCGGIWVANGKFGVTWKLIQAVVQKPKNTLIEGQCYVNIRPSDQEKLKNAAPIPIVKEEDEHEASVLVEDTDDEHEEEKQPIPSIPETLPVEVKTHEEPSVETHVVVDKKRIIRKKV